MPEVRANGRLYCEEHGSGEPLLCIHGTSSSAMVWREAAIEALSPAGADDRLRPPRVHAE